MRRSTLDAVRCPRKEGDQACHGTLRESRVVELVPAESDPGELLEAVLECGRCGAVYPVLCGVLILVEAVEAYFRRRWPYILGAASEHGISASMLRFLHQRGLDDYADPHHEDYDLPRWAQTFTCAHYDDLLDLEGDDHPLAATFARDRAQGFWAGVGDALGVLGDDAIDTALDIGCNVGGMAWRLTSRVGRVLGIDISFGAVLTARRILLGQPVRQTSYTSFAEGRLAHDRRIDVGAPLHNADLLVASAMDLPFQQPFQLVSALNVLDVVPAPAGLLAQAVAAVAPGGWLLVSSPYTWTAEDAPPEEWIGGRDGVASAPALRTRLEACGFEVEWERDRLSWIWRDYSRWFRIYLVHALLARRRHGAAP